MTGQPSLTVRPGRPDDVDWIVALESAPGQDRFIFQWDHDRHLAALGDDDVAYLVAEDEREGRVGYAILRGLASPERSIELMRVVVARPGGGVGRAFLRHIIDWAMAEQHAGRLWLDVFENNARARRVYDALGFEPERTVEEEGRPRRIQMAITAGRPGRTPSPGPSG